MITDCQPSPERLAPLREAMDTYGIEGTDPDWYWNTLSLRTVIYACGVLCREGDLTVHNHDETEYALCQKLSAEAAGLMEGVEVGFGSEASDQFSPFFVVASVGQPTPSEITADTVRAAFGGTIYPQAEIVVEPLVESGDWWESIEEYAEEAEDQDPEDAEWAKAYREKWSALVAWFAGQADLHHASFVAIGDGPSLPSLDENGACVFPRMVLALTHAGSWIGLYGQTVHT